MAIRKAQTREFINKVQTKKNLTTLSDMLYSAIRFVNNPFIINKGTTVV